MSDRKSRARRDGLTLLELLMALAVMALIAAAMAGVAESVRMTSEHTLDQADALQQGRIVDDRIRRAFHQARATAAFPGARVIAAHVDGREHPDAIAIWTSGSPPTIDAAPTVGELTFYTPNPEAPEELLELTAASAAATPAYDDDAGWRTLLLSVAAQPTQRISLTTGVRTAAPAAGQERACLRYMLETNPSRTELAAARAGAVAWEDAAWPLARYGAGHGQVRCWLRWELQMRSGGPDQATFEAVPFFGSATCSFTAAP